MENNHSSKKIFTNSRHIDTVPVAGSFSGQEQVILIEDQQDQNRCPKAHFIEDEDDGKTQHVDTRTELNQRQTNQTFNTTLIKGF